MRFLASLLLLLLLSSVASAQGWRDVFISPGIKIGMSSGPEGGFTFGCEVSVTRGSGSWWYYGLVLGWDGSKAKRQKLHLGAELGAPLVGVEIGPTFVFDRDETRLAWTATPYAGLVIYYYHSFTMLPDETIDEDGAFIKFPFRADGGPLIDFH